MTKWAQSSHHTLGGIAGAPVGEALGAFAVDPVGEVGEADQPGGFLGAAAVGGKGQFAAGGAGFGGAGFQAEVAGGGGFDGDVGLAKFGEEEEEGADGHGNPLGLADAFGGRGVAVVVVAADGGVGGVVGDGGAFHKDDLADLLADPQVQGVIAEIVEQFQSQHGP